LGGSVVKSTTRFAEVLTGAGAALETTPDVLFKDQNGMLTAIADAKYKVLGIRPKAQDTYQILTAAQVLGCRRVALVYPADAKDQPIVWRVQSALGGDDIEMTGLPLNLMSLRQRNGP